MKSKNIVVPAKAGTQERRLLQLGFLDTGFRRYDVIETVVEKS